jgi:hypothetical protein
VDYRDDPIKSDHCIIFVDVDYYADMNQWLQHWKPIMMYTFVPTQLTYKGKEFSYHVDSDAMVSYTISGGATYEHPLWHYTGDTVSILDKYGAICIFDVEQREIDGDPHHRLIWLLPKARIPFVGWIINPYRRADGVSRLVVHNGEIDYLWNRVTDIISVRGPGEYYSVELPRMVFDSIRARLANKDTPVRTSDIERMLGASGLEKEKVVYAPLLLRCWNFLKLEANQTATSGYATSFHALPKRGGSATEDGTDIGRAISRPIVTQPAMFPTKGLNADRSCIEGRVDKPRNTKNPGREYLQYAREFVELVVPDNIAGRGTPLDAQQVAEKQNGKLQKARFRDVIQGMSTVVNNKLKAFIKTEAYAAANDPRNITTMSPELTINMSAYTIPMGEYFKGLQWYGIGKSPKKLIRRMREIAKDAGVHGIVPSDYSRFDGSVSKFLQDHVTLAICLRWLDENHRASFKYYHKEVFKKRAVTAEGCAYDAGSGTRSGSPLTSFNTLKSSYISYCALRNIGYNKQEAYAKLGINAGDDGATANWGGIYRDALEKASGDLGLKCESGIIAQYQPVPFLGRFFADPWTCDETFQDPIRTITKIHLTSNRGLTLEQAACNRAHGYLSTDSLTPLIGTYCRRVLELCGNLKFKAGTHEEQYKCSNSWPQVDVNVIIDAMAKVLNITTDELFEMDRQIELTPSLDQFPEVINTQVAAKCTAIIDGEIHETDSRIIHNRMQQVQNNHVEPRASNSIVEPGSRQGGNSSEHLLEQHPSSPREETRGVGERGRYRTGNPGAGNRQYRQGGWIPFRPQDNRRAGPPWHRARGSPSFKPAGRPRTEPNPSGSGAVQRRQAPAGVSVKT